MCTVWCSGLSLARWIRPSLETGITRRKWASLSLIFQVIHYLLGRRRQYPYHTTTEATTVSAFHHWCTCCPLHSPILSHSLPLLSSPLFTTCLEQCVGKNSSFTCTVRLPYPSLVSLLPWTLPETHAYVERHLKRNKKNKLLCVFVCRTLEQLVSFPLDSTNHSSSTALGELVECSCSFSVSRDTYKLTNKITWGDTLRLLFFPVRLHPFPPSLSLLSFSPGIKVHASHSEATHLILSLSTVQRTQLLYTTKRHSRHYRSIAQSNECKRFICKLQI